VVQFEDMKNSQRGLVIFLIITVVALLVIGGVVYFYRQASYVPKISVVEPISTTNQYATSTEPTYESVGKYGNPLPVVISNITPNHGPVGAVIEVTGKNLAGFEGDLNLWFENADGVKGILYSDNRLNNTYIRATIPAKLCQSDNSYSGLPCKAWLELIPGVYKVYAYPWGEKSNVVEFTLTASSPLSTRSYS
jgi:hypothetical protein